MPAERPPTAIGLLRVNAVLFLGYALLAKLPSLVFATVSDEHAAGGERRQRADVVFAGRLVALETLMAHGERAVGAGARGLAQRTVTEQPQHRGQQGERHQRPAHALQLPLAPLVRQVLVQLQAADRLEPRHRRPSYGRAVHGERAVGAGARGLAQRTVTEQPQHRGQQGERHQGTSRNLPNRCRQ